MRLLARTGRFAALCHPCTVAVLGAGKVLRVHDAKGARHALDLAAAVRAEQEAVA